MGILRGASLLAAALLVACPATASRPEPGEGRILFAEDERIPLPQAPVDIEAADLDGDGHVDIIAATEHGFAVLLGGGAGSFTPAIDQLVEPPPRRILVVDLDGDGRSEVLSTKCDDPDIVVWRWGAGRLIEMAHHTIATPTDGTAAGDLDGDGDQDVVVGSRTANTITTFRNDGAGNLMFVETFSVGPLPGNPYLPVLVDAADMDGDGLLDIVATDAHAWQIVLFKGLGELRFARSADGTFSPDSPISIKHGDLDGDGDTDIAMCGGSGLQALFNEGGSFRQVAYRTRSIHDGLKDIAVHDVDGDGSDDIVALAAHPIASEGSKVILLRGPQFDPMEERAFVAVHSATAFTIADVSADGRIDVVVAARGGWTGYQGLASILRNRGHGLFAATAQFPIPGASMFDFGGHRLITDLAVLEVEGRPGLVLERDNASYLMRNDGRGWFLQPEPMAEAFPVFIEDLNADGYDDIVVPSGAGSWGVKLGDGTGRFAWASTVPGGGTLADMDGDGLRDLVYGLSHGELSYRRNLGGGQFAAAEALGHVPAAARARALVFADFDGRRGDDLALALNGPQRADTIEVWANWHGRELRDPTRAVLESVAEPWMGEEFPIQLEAVDLNRDGRNDLVLLAQRIGEQGYLATFLNGRHGEWADVSTLYAGKEPVEIVVADFDMDGAPDVAIAEINSQRPGRTRVFRGVGDGSLEHVYTYLPGDYAVAIVAADFDVDGLIDLALSCRDLGLIGVHGNMSETPEPRRVVAPVLSAVAEGGAVRVQWAFSPILHARIQRAETGRLWEDAGAAVVGAGGIVELLDTNVTPGRRYGYRLASSDPRVVIDGSEAWVKLQPQGGIIVHDVTSDVGVLGGVALTVEASAEASGTVELFDIGGRRVAAARGVRLSAGAQRVVVPATEPLGQGVYWARVRSGEEVGVGRVVLVR